jgi:hypothetical protein
VNCALDVRFAAVVDGACEFYRCVSSHPMKFHLPRDMCVCVCVCIELIVKIYLTSCKFPTAASFRIIKKKEKEFRFFISTVLCLEHLAFMVIFSKHNVQL